MSSRALYFRILSYFRPYTGPAILALLCMAAAGSVDALIVRMLKDLVDGFAALQKGTQALWLMPAIFFGLAIVRMIANFGSDYLGTWLTSRVLQKLRDETFGRLIRMPVRFFDQSSTGVLLSRVTFDVSQMLDAGLNVLTVIVKDGFLALGLLATMFWTDWKLSLFCLAVMPGVATSIRLVSKRLRRLARETQDTMGEMNRILDESLSGPRIVKIFGGQNYEVNRFGQANNRVRQLMVKRTASSSLNSGISLFLVAIAIAAIVYFAGIRAQAGDLTAGAFISFMGSMLLLQQPVKNLTRVNEQLHRGLAAAETVFAMMDQAVEEDFGTHEIGRSRGEIRFEAVRFSYQHGERIALDGVDIEIRSGETVALVGPSGGGKTTLVNLLPRFYEPQEGHILLDGVPLSDYSLASLRQQIALVSQDVLLFNDTVAANIAYGSGPLDMARVRAAAEASYALDFVEKMDGGFEAMLGENGVRLSGGQRQRLAIARALYKDAPILILDEATSALDTESERQVQAALERLMQGRTTLVIAHRLSTIENADRIVVLQQGRIAEMGTHAELVATGGLYARMHAVQFA
ncbi:MAG: lipid A export permease/ATP-binding protein MsbA, partial [Formivibrio sp.]|nr:lipid A export permease/ATP-binding protein MsbA [Formivibrio sp.]